jgi:hypothetical protein
MDPAQNAGGQSQSELSSMAPMLSIIEEMQRELGELRRSKERGHGSDSEDSDDGSVSVLYRHGFYLRPLGYYGWLMHLLHGGFLYPSPFVWFSCVSFSFSCCQYLVLDVIPLFNVDCHRLRSGRVADGLLP